MENGYDELKEMGINNYDDLLKIYKDINDHNVKISDSDHEYIIGEISSVINSLNSIIEYLEIKYSFNDKGEKIYAEDVNTAVLDNSLLVFFGSLDIVDYRKQIDELQNELEKLTAIKDDGETLHNYN